MKYGEYFISNKEGKSNCVIRSFCKLYNKEYDIVIVAGKGHEDYQIIGGVKHHLDDKEIIKESFMMQKEAKNW